MRKIKDMTHSSVHPYMVWTDIKNDMEFKIITEEFKDGDRVSSISELAESYKVGKSTAQKVLEGMVEDETLSKKKGVGYFVIPGQKEKLKIKHMKEFTNMLDLCVLYAKKLGIPEKELEKLILSAIGRK